MSNPAIAIPADRLPELESAIEKLNKKATKLGCEPISLDVGESFEKQISAAQWADFVPVKVTGEAPQLNGWVLVATLEHDENGTLIRRLPTFFGSDEIDLTGYRKSTPDNCDHCGYRRRRNDTYVVAYMGHRYATPSHRGPRYDHPQIGTTKQVGSSCLKDFTGHENPEAIAKHLTTVRDFIESVQGGSYEGGHITPRHDLLVVMALAAADVRERGYVSRKDADSNRMATAEAVKTLLFQHRHGLTENFLTEDDKRLACNAVQWVRSLAEDDLANEYLANLYTVCKGDSITDSQIGIAVSAITAYQREAKKQRDGDRHQGRVTRTGDEPTDKQLGYIKKLTDELGEATVVPDTRIEASDLINELKVRVEEKRAAEAQPKDAKPEEPATSKQLTFINKLMDTRVIPTEKRQEARRRIDAGLTKARASKCIEYLQSFEESS